MFWKNIFQTGLSVMDDPVDFAHQNRTRSLSHSSLQEKNGGLAIILIHPAPSALYRRPGVLGLVCYPLCQMPVGYPLCPTGIEYYTVAVRYTTDNRSKNKFMHT